MTEFKATRLSKLASEFNVGISTIVEYLRKKGHEVDPNPNAKLAPEMVALVSKEYSTDLNVKKESERIDLPRVKRDKENAPADKDDSADTDDGFSGEVFVKDFNARGNSPAHDPKERKEESVPLLAGPKIVGKMPLDKPKPKVVPTAGTLESKPVKEVQPESPRIPSVQPESPVTPQPVAEKIVPVAEPVASPAVTKEVVADVTPQAPVKAVEPSVVEAAAKPLPEEKPVDVTPQKNVLPESVSAPVVEAEKEAKAAEPAAPPTAAPSGQGIVVIGKMDLDALNPRTKPEKKGRMQTPPAKPAQAREASPASPAKPAGPAALQLPSAPREAAEAETSTTSAPAVSGSPDKDENFIHLPKVRLEGPVIKGRMELPVERSSGSSDVDKAKKKRKRIRKDKEKVAQAGKPVPGAVIDKKREPRTDAAGKNKKKTTGSPAGAKRPLRQEVNTEDVQKQIKDTLARLTAKGTKSRTSKHRRDKRDAFTLRQAEEEELQQLEKNIIKVTEFVSVNELATMMDVPVTEVISTCMNMGLFVSINQRLDAETMVLLADEFNYKVEFVTAEIQEAIQVDTDNPKNLVPRPPIVTVMGHVDHGKTKLLDYIRHANVIAGEAGGITQHIGAYAVKLEDGRQLTFLDTPGHEAFTAMRARGAKITDVAIIVVAADDGVKPQTIEAINHVSAAGVPIVFAINKIDKPDAHPEKVKEELAQMNYLVEDWGGKYQSQDVSAKAGLNVGLLLEKVLLEAELLELKADPKKRAHGVVIESSLDKGRGFVATVLVEGGTLNTGDVVLAGNHTGAIKAMYNERNQRINSAGPATPVLILGLDGAPQAGDLFNVMIDTREARDIANRRTQLQREQGLRTKKHITLDEIGRRIAIGNFQELNLIVKGDVDGSVEALSDSLIKLSTPEIQVNVIHKAVGQISESDVLLAAASNAIVVGFQVRPSANARKMAEKEQIDIRLYSIIYDAIEEIKAAMEGMLSPEIREEIIATIEVREVFKITKVGTVAGCYVREGKITRNSKVRVIREGIVIHSGELGSLKRFKDDVKEVTTGYECGLNIHHFDDLKEGDTIEGYQEVEVKKKL